MFYNTNFEYADIDSFDTSNVTDMESMFLRSVIPNLDFSNFNNNSATTMRYMFLDSKIPVIDISEFENTSIIDVYKIFDGNNSERILMNNQT